MRAPIRVAHAGAAARNPAFIFHYSTALAPCIAAGTPLAVIVADWLATTGRYRQRRDVAAQGHEQHDGFHSAVYAAQFAERQGSAADEEVLYRARQFPCDR